MREVDFVLVHQLARVDVGDFQSEFLPPTVSRCRRITWRLKEVWEEPCQFNKYARVMCHYGVTHVNGVLTLVDFDEQRRRTVRALAQRSLEPPLLLIQQIDLVRKQMPEPRPDWSHLALAVDLGPREKVSDRRDRRMRGLPYLRRRRCEVLSVRRVPIHLEIVQSLPSHVNM